MSIQDTPDAVRRADQATEAAAVAYLQVSGMGCPRCAERVRRGLQQLDGVSLAEVDLEEHLAAVMYDPRQVTPPDLLGAVTAAGDTCACAEAQPRCRCDGHHRYQGDFLAQLPAEVAQVAWT